MTTHNKPRENAHMNLGIGLLVAIVTGIALQSIALGIGLGLVFALTLKAEKATE